ncbi:MAG TPA: glycosyltransferase [Anaerolineales bacterium]|nr:glycosyltransferase [Anaerolineales bacterium]
MKILFVVPYVPNLIRTRPYNLMRFLAERDHQLTLLTLWANEQEKKSLEALQKLGFRVHAVHQPNWRSLLNCLSALPTQAPLQSIYSWNPALAEQIFRLTSGGRRYDAIHVEHLRGARYGLNIKSRLKQLGIHLPIIWDSVDSISLLFRQAMVRSQNALSRQLTGFELKRTERYEGGLVQQFDRVLVTSLPDKKALASLAGLDLECAPISVLRNGVDLAYFQPGPPEGRAENTIVISGKMSYHANVAMALSFVQDIMPLVWARRPDIKVCIVGKDPPRKVRALSQNPKIVVTGTVEDIRPYLQTATLAAAPIAYGVGIQNKVLEAMACGAPVVATPQAVAALESVQDRDVLVAQGPAAFAEAVLVLLNDPRKRTGISQAGRQFVEQQHNWATVAGQLEKIYLEALPGR